MKFTRTELLIISVIALLVGGIISLLLMYPILGLFPFGPERQITVTVQRLYVDVSGSKDSTSSHYMVGTDQGVFECDNSLILGLWNADEKYSFMQAGKKYHLTVKGNKMTNFFFQEFPGVVSVAEASDVIER